MSTAVRRGTLYEMSKGKWPDILVDLAPELEYALAAAPEHVPCPVHGGQDGFRFFEDFVETGGGICNTCGPMSNGFKILAWIKGQDPAAIPDEIFSQVAKWHRSNEGTARPARVLAALPPLDPKKAKGKIDRVWAETRDIADTPVERYLLRRGIFRKNMPKTLRFHQGLDYYDKKVKLGTWPAMVAPVTAPNGEKRSLHRTFITPDGLKAPVPDPKKLMAKAGSLRGCAIKLYPAGKRLDVGEGIETMLAVRAITGLPVWSLVNTSLLKTIVFPEDVEEVGIWADKDRAHRNPATGESVEPGQVAAEILAERCHKEGRNVHFYLPSLDIPPSAKGVDWLNVLVEQGPKGFPEEFAKKWMNS